MQTCVGHFTDCVYIIQVGFGIKVGHHSAAAVVRSRHDWDRFTGYIDTKRAALTINIREVLNDKVSRLMTDIQVHAVSAQSLHFIVDCASDYVARRKIATLIKFVHKAGTVGVAEVCAFAAQRFCNQKVTCLRVK